MKPDDGLKIQLKSTQMNSWTTPNHDFNEQWYNQFNCPTPKTKSSSSSGNYIMSMKITQTKLSFVFQFQIWLNSPLPIDYFLCE